MIILQIHPTAFNLELTEEEALHFAIIADNSLSEFVDNVPTLLQFTLTFIEQHWYDTLPEPEFKAPEELQ